MSRRNFLRTSGVYPPNSILLQDSFSGTVVDSTKWIVNETGGVNITQNNELIFTDVSATSVTILQSRCYSKKMFNPKNIDLVLKYDFKQNNPSNIRCPFGSHLISYYSGVDILTMQTSSSTPNALNNHIYKNNTQTGFSNYTLDISTYKSVKIKISSNTVYFYYWNGSSWTQGNTGTYLANKMLYVTLMRQTRAGNTTSYIKNLYLTNYDYSTQNP